jgi:hypothetical protein
MAGRSYLGDCAHLEFGEAIKVKMVNMMLAGNGMVGEMSDDCSILTLKGLNGKRDVKILQSYGAGEPCLNISGDELTALIEMDQAILKFGKEHFFLSVEGDGYVRILKPGNFTYSKPKEVLGFKIVIYNGPTTAYVPPHALDILQQPVAMA